MHVVKSDKIKTHLLNNLPYFYDVGLTLTNLFLPN